MTQLGKGATDDGLGSVTAVRSTGDRSRGRVRGGGVGDRLVRPRRRRIVVDGNGDNLGSAGDTWHDRRHGVELTHRVPAAGPDCDIPADRPRSPRPGLQRRAPGSPSPSLITSSAPARRRGSPPALVVGARNRLRRSAHRVGSIPTHLICRELVGGVPVRAVDVGERDADTEGQRKNHRGLRPVAAADCALPAQCRQVGDPDR